jgi:hypothetical protein
VLINPVYELHRDEYLHLDQGKHLAWGYLSVPPLTSWISYLILHFDNNIFVVKFFPALFGVLTLVIMWKAIEELNGNIFALLAGACAITFSVLLRVNILFQPNSLDILCWTLVYFSFLKFINSERKRWLWIGGLSCAIGMLNKYNIVFLVLGMLPAIILTKHRTLFLNRHFYFSVIFALLLVAPNIAWQVMHDFSVFHHMSDLVATQLVNVHRIDFLKEQLLFFTGSMYLWIAALFSFFIYSPFRKCQVFFWSFVFTLSLFLYLKAKGYYAIGLYPILIAFGSVYTEYLLRQGWKRFLKPVIITLMIFAFIPFIKVAFPVLPPAEIEQKAKLFERFDLLKWEDGKNHSLPQDFADMLGWKEMAAVVDSTFDGINSNTLVLCDNYGEAGAINYYTRHKNVNAVSFNADYINWFSLKNIISNIILVTEKDGSLPYYAPQFHNVKFMGTVNNKFAREYGTNIYLLENPKFSINYRLKKEILARSGF